MNGMCGKSGDHLPNVIRTPPHSTLEEHTNVIATPPALQTFPTGGERARGGGDRHPRKVSMSGKEKKGEY